MSTVEMVALTDVVEILDRFRVPVSAKQRQLRVGAVPYYGATGQAGWIDEPIFDEPLVLLGEDAVPFLDPSAPKAYPIDGPSWVNNHAHVLRALPGKVDRAFLVHSLNVADYRGLVNGTTRLKLTQASMKELRIPLPPLAEQRCIVARLAEIGNATTRGAYALGQATTLTEQLRQSVLFRAFDGPSDTTIGEVGEVFVGATPSRADPALWDGTVPWVSSGEVAFDRIGSTREGISESALRNASRRIHPVGTVLVAMIGEGRTRGQAAILDIPAAHNQNCASIRLDRDRMLPEYLFYWFMARYDENRGGGAGSQQPALNGKLVKSLRIPCPPLTVQAAVVADIGAWFTRVEALAGNIENTRTLVRALDAASRYRALRTPAVP
ncbi:unannotated protein [freshwater metagenome]|uniref:Unannotated protein n=1 Tax=freshwater metagenome TaxID=449393 RepID=A0A6J7GE78_9ZZZZ|nr:hypothetical protein [Actinomycetota bacterium]